MKQLLGATILVAIMLLCLSPGQLFAQGDTLVIFATGATLDKVILGDTLSNGTRAHHVYKLPSRDTTYIFDGAITVNTDFTVLGVLDPVTGRPPCIQPDVVGGQVPQNLFVLTGNNTHGTFKNLYLLGLALNNSPNLAGTAIQISADNVRLVVDNVVFEEWLGFAIGYNGSNDKFFVNNSRFRNMVHPNQWYVGEVLRNEYPGAVPTDSIVFKYNTMFCINGYAAAPVTKYYVSYFEFTHNTVVYTFKNPFFIFNVTNAKLNNNIFYANYAGGISKTEYPWWDQLWSPEVGSVIDMDKLDAAKDSVFDPGDVGNPKLDSLAETKRNVEVRNNAYFWPSTLTSFWTTSWNDTAHTDSIYLPSWMNTRTTNMFTDKARWPGFVESGNLNMDPGFGASIPNVLTQSPNGLLDWFVLCRRGTLSNTYWDYQKTVVGTAVNWVPAWPLPESADMQYTDRTLKTGGTDGLPIGDPKWFGVYTGVTEQPTLIPREFALSQNYPNPFNPSTRIEFSIPFTTHVQLKVYNILGQEVATLVNETMTVGNHSATLDASKLSSGVYLYKIIAGSFVSTRKMVLLK